ncbi:hypothetical protein P154DRAFT_484135 [Amniculicola lignicola CBS 123094]|uniref:RAD52 homolog n=1 Tax=Amniculicola lignicola CBS 123094 TaxID=1392246 RepID=A0A6A5WSI2_9PLEO|nr:hypothetical protein P154DRAFT_484135 [Amniculicola lignicola CBS 123094]
MPAPGDQYESANITNPFEERKVNVFTAREIATLQSRLNKQLGPEYISSRTGAGGGKVAYLEGNKAIALANEVFGFNGWSSGLREVQIDYVDENPQTGRVNLGLSITVRVSLKDGTFHEDIGYGSIENAKGKAAAFEKAKKEAATDGLKRALRTFGNVLGNCLYDKEYLKKVNQMKVKPIKFEEGNLYRHPSFAPPPAPPKEEEEWTVVKKETHKTPMKPSPLNRTSTEQSIISGVADFEDEFGSNLFDGVEISENHGHDFTFDSGNTPNGAATARKAAGPPSGPAANGSVSKPNSQGQNGAPPREQVPRVQSMPVMQPPQNGPIQQPNGRLPGQQYPQNGPQTPGPPQNNGRPDMNRPRNSNPTVDIHAPPKPQYQPQPPPPQHQGPPKPDSQRATVPPPANAAPYPPPPTHHAPVGFVTSRAAVMMQGGEIPAAHLPAFNPHAESPLPPEKRTPGIDHKRSMKIKRQEVGAPNLPLPPGPPAQSSMHQNQSGGGPAANPGFSAAGGAGGGMPASRPVNPSRTNFVNPHHDANRRIGMPGVGAMSPLANRGAYKPPGLVGVKRPPLQDVSNKENGGSGSAGVAMNGGAGAGGEGHDAKRQRLEGPGENGGNAVVGV